MAAERAPRRQCDDAGQPATHIAQNDGENALHVASLGLPVVDVGAAETALATARERADDRIHQGRCDKEAAAYGPLELRTRAGLGYDGVVAFALSRLKMMPIGMSRNKRGEQVKLVGRVNV
jgi:hypothetical protein